MTHLELMRLLKDMDSESPSKLYYPMMRHIITHNVMLLFYYTIYKDKNDKNFLIIKPELNDENVKSLDDMGKITVTSVLNQMPVSIYMYRYNIRELSLLLNNRILLGITCKQYNAMGSFEGYIKNRISTQYRHRKVNPTTNIKYQNMELLNNLKRILYG